MTEEEANEYIASKTIAAGISPEEALDELNKELRPNGWEIRTVKRIGGAWFLDCSHMKRRAMNQPISHPTLFLVI